jgi:DNA-binding SARP family transcriptional activator/tetratricopeptide (TPR) repeat protein
MAPDSAELPDPASGAAGGAPLQISLIGRPHCTRTDGSTLELNARDAALIALLALDGPQPRDTLAGRLWPDASQRQAPNNLRKAVSRLRVQVGHPLVDFAATVALRADVAVDVLDPDAIDTELLLGGELLAGCDYTSNDFLLGWVEARREAFRARAADALAGQAEALERSGELVRALRLAARIVELVPKHEVAWRRLMRLHYLRADHSAAVAAFERFEALLRDDTGGRPSAETMRLLDTIERGAQAATGPRRRLPLALIHPPRCVGREGARQAIERAWSGGRAFLLIGPAGIGKSRLLDELIGGRGDAVKERSRPGDAGTPYALLARVLRALLARLAGTGRRLDDFVHRELARLLPELGAPPAAPAQEPLLRLSIEELLRAALDEGLAVLALDDLQFSDLASLEALRWLHASPKLAALRLGMALRWPEDGERRALFEAWLLDSQRPERIDLEPLSPAALAELLHTLDLPEFVGPALAARLHAHAGGHPLFTLETLKDAWLNLGSPGSDELPRASTVQALIEGRLRALPGGALDLLRVAAVAGNDLDATRAARLLGVAPLALAADWALLERAGILQGTRFAHDLLLEGALALVPQALRQALHGALAELLAADASVPAARVAAHWQSAQRWRQAGQAWHRAATDAGRAARVREQHELLERAAACHRQAGERTAEFEAVRAGLDTLLLLHGGHAVLGALPRLEALAEQPAEQLACHLVHAEALVDVERSAPALEQAAAAVRLAALHPARLGDALCLQGMALAQLARADEAARAGRQAVEAANAAGDPAQELRATRALAYALYMLGRLGEALPVQQRAWELAQQLGDDTECVIVEAALAALQSAAGDVRTGHALASSAAERCARMGLAQDSSLAITNLIVLGNAALYLGRFAQAQQALETAVRQSTGEVNTTAQAKARLSLALVRLRLGDADGALGLARLLPAGSGPALRMQAALVLALAEQQRGRSGADHLRQLGQLGDAHPDLPFMQAAWFEWSYQGESATVLARLAQVRAEAAALGLPGAARSLHVREVARLLDTGDDASARRAADGARELKPHVATGLHAKSYPPEVWWVLAGAFQRAGMASDAADCVRAAQAWLRQTALPQVPEALHEAFLVRHPLHRTLLAAEA